MDNQRRMLSWQVLTTTLLLAGYAGYYLCRSDLSVPNTASYTDPTTGKTVYGYAALTATPALRQQNLKFPNFAEVLTRNNGPSDR